VDEKPVLWIAADVWMKVKSVLRIAYCNNNSSEKFVLVYQKKIVQI
jgi:hypothetical protein